MELLRGKPVSDRIEKSIRKLVCRDKTILSVFLTGSDPSSVLYARSKERKGRKLGVDVRINQFPESVEEEELLEIITEEASREEVKGIMIERPVAPGLNLEKLMGEIPPEKDVEGMHPVNLGRLFTGNPYFIPPTPLGAVLLMRHYSIETEGKKVLVIGRSPNVGRPLSVLLSQKRTWGNSTVTLAHSRTRDLPELSLDADIVVSAVGKAGHITGDMVNDEVTIIDMGINPLPNGSMVGDVDIGSMEGRNVKVTPTPGGTGPVTVSSMFLNIALSCARENDTSFSGMDPMITEIYR
jgi:methylenetetrahydrofolate dehydrogenase (NADP+)/methenyltetrahydrofolate cyclohydrolase